MKVSKRRRTRRTLEYYLNHLATSNNIAVYIMRLPNYTELVDMGEIDEENLEKVQAMKTIKVDVARKILKIFINSLNFPSNIPNISDSINIIIPELSKDINKPLIMKKNSLYIPIKIHPDFINIHKIILTYEQHNILTFLGKWSEYTIVYFSILNNLEIIEFFQQNLEIDTGDMTELIKYNTGETTYSYIDIYNQCMEHVNNIKNCNIIFLIADITVSAVDPSPLVISKTFKKSKNTYGFRVSINKQRTRIEYNYLLSLNRTIQKTKNKFKILINLKSLNTNLLTLLKFNIKKHQQIISEEVDSSIITKNTEKLKINITNNIIFNGIEFILGPEKRRRMIKDNRILSNIMYKNSEGDKVILGEFRGPLQTDETDNSEKNCKIIWNDDGNKMIAELSDKL